MIVHRIGKYILSKRTMLFSCIVLLILLLGYMHLYINYSRPIKINFEKVNKIDLYYVLEDRLLVTIDNPDDVIAVCEIVKRAKGGYRDYPSCPFSLSLLLYMEDNKKVLIDFGTDDCGLVRYRSRYYKLHDKDIMFFQLLIERLAKVPFDSIRL